MTIAAAGASLANAFLDAAAEIRASERRSVSIYAVDACAFCSAIGVMNKCSWVAEKEAYVCAINLRVGDRVRVGPGFKDFSLVEVIDLSPDKKTVLYQLACWKGPRSFDISCRGLVPQVRAVRTMPCAAACCDLCSVERADGVHACRDHWMDWSKIA